MLLSLLTIFLALLAAGEAWEHVPLTAEQRQHVIDIHNKLRRKEVTEEGANNMRIIEWNADLEKFAFNYIKTCTWRRSKFQERQNLGPWGITGENNWGSKADTVSNVTKPVSDWYLEKPNFDYDANKCAANKMCGHYTQVVWAETYVVGCAQTVLGMCSTESLKSLFFCNYGPNSDEPKGGESRKPFLKGGEPCSGCTGEWADQCIDGLCNRVASEKDLNLTDYDAEEEPKGGPKDDPKSIPKDQVASEKDLNLTDYDAEEEPTGGPKNKTKGKPKSEGHMTSFNLFYVLMPLIIIWMISIGGGGKGDDAQE